MKCLTTKEQLHSKALKAGTPKAVKQPELQPKPLRRQVKGLPLPLRLLLRLLEPLNQQVKDPL